MKYSPAQVAKAIGAALLAAATVIVEAGRKGSIGTPDYIAAVVAALVAGVSVFLIPNAPAAPKVA